jgi:hypothetical protein
LDQLERRYCKDTPFFRPFYIGAAKGPFLPGLKLHKHEIFFYFYCRNQILMVPRACNMRFLKIIFDSAEIFDF